MTTNNDAVFANSQLLTLNSQQTLVRSRIILPVSTAPIRDGAILIEGDRIIAVGKWKDISRHPSLATRHALIDLGDSILLPGLVNAHCHLDYTDMAGLMPPQKSFTDWIKLITATKAEWSYSEFAESWLHGAAMLLRTGTTTVADFENVPELLPDVWTATPLRVISFLEMTGVRSRRDPRLILQENLGRIEALSHERSFAAIAPHAPYSTIPELLKISAAAAQKRKWPISIHVSESAQEFQMFTRRAGEMFRWLKYCERDMSDCGRVSPVQHLHRHDALGENLLAVHVNYLGREDATILKKRKVSVAHCPRSHSYFGHTRFPFAKLVKTGINICLGTDSLATVLKSRKKTVELNMFDEMRAFATNNPRVSAEIILRMSTINGARALGLAGKIGQLSSGAAADLIAIPHDEKISDACEIVIQHRGQVSASMIAGRWAIAPQSR
jgi:cytosine/adenosine deaminase-related metal-dependent hydrolase